MTIKSSGVLKMTDIVAEFGGTPPYNLSNYYGGGPLVPAGIGVPSSGVLKLSDFYGKTKTLNNYLNATPGPYSGVVPAGAWAAKVIIRGGGGGGGVGAGTNGGGGSDPGPGGGCGYHQSFVIPVTPGQTFSGYIGAGGIGGYVGGSTTVNVPSTDADGNPITVTKTLFYLHNGGDGGATTFTYNGTTNTANGGQGAGSVNHNSNSYILYSGTAADGYPGAGEYNGSWPYDGKGAVKDGAGAGAGTGGPGYNSGSVSMDGGPGSTLFNSTPYPGGVHTGWASSGPGGGGDLGPGGNGGSNWDGGAGGLGGGGGGGNSDDWNTDGRGGAGGNGYVYIQWLYHNQSWYNPGTYSWSVPAGIYYIGVNAIGAGGGGGGGAANQGFPDDGLCQGFDGVAGKGFTVYRNGSAILSVAGGAAGKGNGSGTGYSYPEGWAPTHGQDSALAAGGAIASQAGQWIINGFVAGGNGFAGSGGAGGWKCTSTGDGHYSGLGGNAGQSSTVYLNVNPGDVITFVIPDGGTGGWGNFHREVNSYGFPRATITGYTGSYLYYNDSTNGVTTITNITNYSAVLDSSTGYITVLDSNGSTRDILYKNYVWLSGYSNPLTASDPNLTTVVNNNSYSNGQDGGKGGAGCVRIFY
jgi:hypothetical protein